MRKKRIAILMPGGVGDTDSGMHIPAIYELVERLSMAHDLHVYSLAPANSKHDRGSCGNATVKFISVHANNGTAKKIWLLCRACLRDHREVRFSLFHAFWAIPCGVTAMLLGRLLRLPVVVSFLGGETANLPQIPYGNMIHRSTTLTTTMVARQADALVTLTHHQMRQVQMSFRPSRVRRVIPFGANETIFTPVEKDVTAGPLRLLYVGNIHAVKDYSMLLKTFQLLTRSVNASLRIIGPDQSSGKIVELARSMGVADHIDFLGHVPHHQLAQHYHWAHVLLLTSLHEAQGVVVGEAAASGVLVAGTRTGLLADLGESAAVVSPIGDHEELVRKLMSVVVDPQSYNAVRVAGQQWARSHDMTWTATEYGKLYGHMVGKDSDGI